MGNIHDSQTGSSRIEVRFAGPFFQIRRKLAISAIAIALIGAAFISTKRVRAETQARVEVNWPDLKSRQLVMIVSAATITSQTTSEPSRHLSTAGYLVVVAVGNHDNGTPDYKLYGPLWRLPESNPGRPFVPQIVVGHPMRAPFLNDATSYYDTRGDAVFRWIRIGKQSEHRYNSSHLDMKSTTWSLPRIVEVPVSDGETVSPRHRFELETVNVTARAFGMRVYDSFTDRYSDDKWVNDALSNLDDSLSPASYIIDSNLNWIIIEPRHLVIDDRKHVDRATLERESPAAASYKGLQFNRDKSFLLLRRDAKPIAVDRLMGNTPGPPNGPNDAFSAPNNNIFFVYEKWPTPQQQPTLFLAPLNGGKPYELTALTAQLRGLAHGEFDASNSTLSAADVSGDPIPMDRRGAAVGCEITIKTWKYLDGKLEQKKIRLDDLFRIEDGKLVPNPARTTAIAP